MPPPESDGLFRNNPSQFFFPNGITFSNVHTEVQSIPFVNVYVKDMPTDFVSIFASLFAAFFGAAAAFVFNHWNEARLERLRQRDAINGASYLLFLNMNALLNFKGQFLYLFTAEFTEALSYLGKMRPTETDVALQKLREKVIGVLTRISKQDESLNGVFQPWEDIDFLDLPQRELAFSIFTSPDIVRLLDVATRELTQVSKRVAQRNRYRGENIGVAMADTDDSPASARTLLIWYQMFDYRRIILEHVDVALAVMAETATHLERFRIAHFPTRGRLRRALLGPEKWITYSLPEAGLKLMPDRALHTDVLDGI